MSGTSADGKHRCDIARLRAQQFLKVRQETNPLRARSQDGHPVAYQKEKSKASICGRSRVMSDPDISACNPELVILNAKGLFKGKDRSQSKPELSFASVDRMDEESPRPIFFDPCNGNNNKESIFRVSDLKKRFESLEHDNFVNAGSEYFNPLHKVNQAASSSTGNKVRTNVQEKLEKVLHVMDSPLEPIENEEDDSVYPLKRLNDNGVDKRTRKIVPEFKQIEKGSNILDSSAKQSNSQLKEVKVTSETMCEQTINETSTPPSRPPPRAPRREPLNCGPEKSCPMSPGGNRLSQGLSSPKKEMGEVGEPFQLEKTDDFVQSKQTREFNSGSSHGNDSNYSVDIGDDDDDEDDNVWGSDFEDDEDQGEEVNGLKRDSRSSHESSNDVETMEFPDAVSRKLYNIASEILTTERAYVGRLHLLDQVFYSRLNAECCAQGSVPVEALNDIFSNIQAIHQLHRDFLLPKLEGRMEKWATNNQIGDILKGLAPFLKMYTHYVGNFDKATETLSTWMKKSAAMTAIIEEIQKSKECENLTLQHHMLEPVQRVPRYQLLLKDYLSKLPEDSPDLKNTSDALDIIAKAAQRANDSMKKTERFKILLEIQDRIGVDYPLITASREFVMEGEFKKVAARTSDSHQERTLMLFNDVLLCCAKFPGSNKYKVKVEMDLYGMEVKTEDEDLEVENAFRIISKQRVMDFTAPNAEARETFVNKLQETVDELASKRESYRRARNIEVLKEGDLGKKAPTWVRDEAVSMCMLCDVMFTRFRRRHHCRACGRVVCGNCSGYKAALEFKNGKLEKVCEVCHRILVKGSTEEKAKEAVVKGKSILKIDSDKRIWHSGYLSFKMKGDKTWQKRWFVLSSDFVLFRYKAKKDIKAELNLPLPGHFVDKPSLADEVDRGNVFKVHHKNVRVYLFQAENKESMNRWMELLTKATKAEQVDEEQVQGDKKTQRANSE